MYSLEPEKKYDQFMGELTDNPVRTYKDDILICIFNYRNDDIAKKWLHMLQPFFDVYVLDSGNIHEEKEFMQFPNIYYSGLFNEMKKLSERKRYKFIGMIPSDITLMCEPSLLIDRIKWLMLTCNIGLWQPSLDADSRPWADNFHSNGPELLSKKVLEGHFLFMKSDVLKAVDYINLSENKFGYGISEIICGLSMKLGYGNVFDNTLQIHHPNDTGYSMTSAAKESKNWTPAYCEKYGLDYCDLLDI